MANEKVIFIAFAIQDERQRDLLSGQRHLGHSPVEYVDMSVKEPYDSGWKDKVRTRIRRSNGVVILVSNSSLNSSGQKWEIDCAREERKPILAIWAYKDDRTILAGLATKEWTWPTVANFIDNL